MKDNQNRAWESPTLVEYGSIEQLTKWHGGEKNKHLGGDDGYTFSEGQDSIGPFPS